MADIDALLKLGVTKSNYLLIRRVSETLKDKILRYNEEKAPYPASFTNIFLEEFGRINALGFYEQMMYKNEMLPSTAIKLRSLLNKMSDEMLQSIYGTPAKFNVVLGFRKNEINRWAIQNSPSTKILTINKNIVFKLDDKPQFTIDHNINIVLNDPSQKWDNASVYVMYDINDRLNPDSLLYSISSPYLSTQEIRVDNEQIIVIFIPARQYIRTVQEYDVFNDASDHSFNYTNELYGFELGYCPKSSTKYIYKKGYPDGNIAMDGYNFSLDLKRKVITFNFNRNAAYFKPNVGDHIRIIIYSTSGEAGNFNIPNIYENYEGLSFQLNQDRSYLPQDTLLKLVPYISMRDGLAVGGANMKEFEEIRRMVINWGSNSKVLTPGEFERKAEVYNLKAVKVRDDIRCLEYKASGILYDNLNAIVGATTKDLVFPFTDVPIDVSVNARFISPKDVFVLDKVTQKLNYLKKPPTYNEEVEFMKYLTDYKYNSKNYMFPYHIKFINDNYLHCKIFNMNIKDNQSANFVFYNTRTLNPTSILSMDVHRDVINENTSDIPEDINSYEVKGYFEISFDIFTDHIIAEQLYAGNVPIIYRIEIQNRINRKQYATDAYFSKDDIDLKNNIIRAHFYLPTSDVVDTNDRICIKNSLATIPYVTLNIDSQYIESNVDIKIFVLQKNTIDADVIKSNYDYIIKPHATTGNLSEIDQLFFVSIVYEVKNVTLFKDYTSYFKLLADLKVNEPMRKTLDMNSIGTDGQPMFGAAHDPSRGIYTGVIVEEKVGYEIIKATRYKFYPQDVTEVVRDENGAIIYKTVIIPEEDSDGHQTNFEVQVPLTRIIHKKGDFILSNPLKINPTTPNSIYYDPRTIEWAAWKAAKEEAQRDPYYNEDVYNANYPEPVCDKADNYVENYVKLYSIGDVYYTLNGNQVVNLDVLYTGIIKNLPVYDRIYSRSSDYNVILSSYEKLIDSVRSLLTYAPDGVELYIGIKSTSGRGDFEVYNLQYNIWEDIDDIALSFNIGVKYSDVTSNIDDNNAQIKSIITNYIYTFNGISFSIDNIFTLLKEKIDNIEYLLLYNINNYPASQVQSIRKRNNQQYVNDVLSIKRLVSNLSAEVQVSSNDVTFEPDITIRVLE
jgi:hypothetical protein